MMIRSLNHMVGQHVVVTNGPPAILGKTGEVMAIADNDCQMLVRVHGVKEPTFDEWPLHTSQVQVLPNIQIEGQPASGLPRLNAGFNPAKGEK